MAAHQDVAMTAIHRFLQVATAADYSSAQSIDCCGDVLTYGQLLALVERFAADLHNKFGDKPVVSFISENHPYVLISILATWLLGGVIAPLDYHAPEALLRGMLEGVRPTCVILPDTAVGNIAIVEDMGLVALPFVTSESGIPSLLKKFSVDSASSSSINTELLPNPEDDAIYLYTSSASSTTNLKCVPIDHTTLYSNTTLELETWRVRRNVPVEDQPERFRVLGWGPFSHVMSLANDFTCHCLIPVGCYIFGVPPSTYPITESSGVSRPVQGQAYDVGAILLQTAYRAKADMISGVPWLYKRIMEECSRNPQYLDYLKSCRQLLSGGALTDDDVQNWAEEHGLNLDVSIGMTELCGALFETDFKSILEGGYPIKEALVAGATLTLVDEDGVENDNYGELLIRSRFISRGYRNFKSSTHSTDDNGVTTFSTGDIYSCTNGRLLWKGRREDYIQLGSAELLDPRVPERELLASSSIARVALVGDNFLRGAAEVVCAIVEPSEDGFQPQEVLRAFASVNKTLHPPLRVPASRILVLSEGEKIPMTRKGLIWRKALEERFGERMKALLEDPKLSRFREIKKEAPIAKSLEEVENEVTIIIAEGLGISGDLLEENRDSSFAELGMDSNMATRIVSKLNSRFGLDFPMSACHDYVDLPQLAAAICDKLNQKRGAVARVLAPQTTRDADDDVVIVGQAFRLPGNVNDEHAFWKALVEKLNVLQHMGNDRWNHDSFYVPPGSATKPPPGTINFTQMGRIEVASYDNAFFGISPAEAYFVTPGARCALEVAVEALEDANIPLSSIKGSNLAVFVAQGPEFGYPDLIYTEKGFEVYDRYYGTGVADSAISGRLSYFLDVHGPSVTLNTACSGGLVALDNAMMAIRYGACETAIVCSVNVHVWPGNFGFLSANQMSSLHGRCATFSKDADGYVPSEGAMAFIVKSKRAALRDGDNILGVIKSTSVQHNGRSQGLVAPNSKAQVALQRSVLSAAGLNPADIDFIENHGTGTILGDQMEIQAINEVFSGSHTIASPLVLGAAKTIFGHTESSAGLVGVAKALQTLRHHIVPGLAHLNGENLSPRIDTTVTPLHISHLATNLSHRTPTTPLRALSLSFGFAGTIAAIVLEEFLTDKDKESIRQTEPTSRLIPHLFVVSAKTEKALLEYIKSYIEFCSTAQESDLADICYTSCVGREHYRFRFACTCTSLKDLVDQLSDVLSSKKPVPAILSKPRVAFAFPGQGTQWQGMGRSFSDLDKTFASYLLDYAEQASSLLGIDLAPLLFEPQAASTDDKRSIINETHISQSCIFVFQCAVAKWLNFVGISPNGILAHSLGEIAAAVSSRSMDFKTALEFIVVRSNAMRPEFTNGGLMAAIRAPVAPIIKRINALGLNSSVTIAAYNSDTQNVVSGDEASVRKLVDDLSIRSIKGTILSVNQGFHSHCIDNALGPIRSHCENAKEQLKNPSIPYFSSVEGRALKTGDHLDSDYWVKQARQPVRFADAARSILEEGKFNAILDIGPQNVISHLLKDAATRASSNVSITSLCDRPTTDLLNPLVQTIATLYKLGITPDFQNFYSGRRIPASKVALPTYPWQRQRHYPTIIPSRTSKIKGIESSDSYVKTWKIGKELGHLLQKDHTLNSIPIVPAAALAMFVSLEAKKSRGEATLVDMRILKPILLEELEEEELRIDIKGANFSCTHLRGSVEKAIVCSGSLKEVASISPGAQSLGDVDTILDKAAVYEKFSNNLVKFGENFQCIQTIEVSPTMAIGRVEVPSSGNSQNDFVRKMDAVFHMFGAIAPEGPPELQASGNFLPSALNGLVLHSESFPETFTCTYRLPVKVAPSNKMMSVELQVRSDAGDLLLSCTDYVVSWIPSSIPVARTPAPKGSIPLLKTNWISKSLPTLAESDYAEVIYFGSGLVRESLEATCREKSIPFTSINDVDTFFGASECRTCSKSSLNDDTHTLLCKKRKDSCYIIYDATVSSSSQISESTITSYSVELLDVLKKIKLHLLSRSIKSAVVLTQNSLSIDFDGNNGANGTDNAVPGTSLGSIAHGMVRVLRQECESQLVSAIDLPDSIPTHQTGACILNELTASISSRTSPVAYRFSKERKLTRLASQLVEDGHWAPVTDKLPSGTRRTVVVVGMDNFGIELIRRLIDSGDWSTVIILNDRPQSDIQIASTLIDLEVDDIVLRYEQVDIASYSAVHTALGTITKDSPRIHSIIHTTGNSKASSIEATSERELTSALKYKAIGAWNLHHACEELHIEVERFILLSSVSVTLGKAGNISTVSGCSFMDELARYRSSVYPGSTYSVQIGAWESTNEANNSQEIDKISYDIGLPLLISTLKDTKLPVVSILAKLRFGALRGKGLYSSDPYFATVINSVSSQEPVVAVKATAAPTTVTTSKVSGSSSVGVPSVQKFVSNSLRNILGLSSADMENLDSSTPVLSLGIDSISFTQLRADVSDKYEVDLPMSFLGEETLTLAELSEFIVDAAKEQRGSETSETTETTESETVVAEREFSPKDAEKFIAESLKNVLGMSSADMENFDSSTPILSLGIDSISFTQLRADVLKKFNVDIPMSFLGEDTLTLSELAEFTVEKAGEAN